MACGHGRSTLNVAMMLCENQYSKSTCLPKNCFLIHKTNKRTAIRPLGKADHRDQIKALVSCQCNSSAVANIKLLNSLFKGYNVF